MPSVTNVQKLDCNVVCFVNTMHITASVFINDDEPGLHEDYKKWLKVVEVTKITAE